MFGKKTAGSQGGATVIGRGDRFEGTLRVSGMLHVDGEIVGSIVVNGLVSIGPAGLVQGEIEADKISVAGKIEGRTYARGHLHMLATGIVRGEVCFASLQVDRGGLLDGHTSVVELDSSAVALLSEGDAEGDTGEDPKDDEENAAA